MIMMTIKPGRLFTSLFSKLLLILLVTGLFINLLVVGFFVHHIRQAARDTYVRNAINYLNYLTQDIGSPPDLEKAKAISQRYSLHIYYNSPDLTWATSETPLPTSGHSWRMTVEGKDYDIRVSRGQRMATLYKDSGRFTFMSDRDFSADVDVYKKMALLIAVLTGILLLAFLALRWILKPIRWLHDGVGQVGAGNLDYHVPGNRSDQLGDLVAAFNQMTDRIRNMLRDRDQLLLDVSHELRTPLTRMKVALEFLSDGRAKSTLREDIVEMEEMVTAILDEARLRHGNIVRQPVDLSKLLQGIIGEFKNRRPPVETKFDQVPIFIDAAPELVRMVFRNIIDNALKYSEPNGPPVTVHLEQAGGETVVSVSDHGSGIAKDELSRIFEPFYRVDKSRSRDTGGYGIGLSLCKTIMDAHGGSIDAESEPEKGTVMRIRFFKEPDKIKP
jgi:signal transduction histidine kinase